MWGLVLAQAVVSLLGHGPVPGGGLLVELLVHAEYPALGLLDEGVLVAGLGVELVIRGA